MTCALGTIANGGNASVEIKVRPQDGGQITNQATVSSDRRRSGCRATTRRAPTTTVDPVCRPVADQDGLPRPGPGRRAAHLHARASTTPGLRAPPPCSVTDTLPAGVTFDSATPTQGTCPSPAAPSRARSARWPTGPTRASRSRSVRRQGGTITNHGQRRLRRSGPGLRRTTPRAPTRRSTRPRTSRSRRPTRRIRRSRASSSPTR